jgi:hypothetical protein
VLTFRQKAREPCFGLRRGIWARNADDVEALGAREADQVVLNLLRVF